MFKETKATTAKRLCYDVETAILGVDKLTTNQHLKACFSECLLDTIKFYMSKPEDFSTVARLALHLGGNGSTISKGLGVYSALMVFFHSQLYGPGLKRLEKLTETKVRGSDLFLAVYAVYPNDTTTILDAIDFGVIEIDLGIRKGQFKNVLDTPDQFDTKLYEMLRSESEYRGWKV